MDKELIKDAIDQTKKILERMMGKEGIKSGMKIMSMLDKRTIESMMRTQSSQMLRADKEVIKLALEIQKLYPDACGDCDECCKKCNPFLSEEDIVRLHKIDGEKVWNKIDPYRVENYLKLPCPYLKDGKCAVYDYRPTVCRVYPFLLNNPWILSMSMIQIAMCPMGKKIHTDIYRFARKRRLIGSIDVIEKSDINIFATFSYDIAKRFLEYKLKEVR